jgi:hypothetical protein
MLPKIRRWVGEGDLSLSSGRNKSSYIQGMLPGWHMITTTLFDRTQVNYVIILLLGQPLTEDEGEASAAMGDM